MSRVAASELQAGPMVQMILARRREVVDAAAADFEIFFSN